MPGSMMSPDIENDRDRERARSKNENRERNSGRGDRDRSPLARNMKKGRVMVSNIPYEYRWQDLKDLFRTEVGEVIYVELFNDENDKPKGCGVIEFANPDLAQVAIEKMHRYELKGRKIVVKEDRGDNDKPRSGGDRGRHNNNNNSNAGSQRGQWSDQNSNNAKWGNFNTYGLSVNFLESLNISGPLINKVFVANLDYKVDEKKLREVFKLAGRVLCTEILVDKEGKSRGFGTVEFDHPVEAVQAISMFHNQQLYDRRINVRLDKANDGPTKLPDGLKSVGMGLGANGAPLTDVARNLPSMNNSSSPSSQPVGLAGATPTLAALAGNLEARILERAVANQHLVGSLGSTLAADLVPTGSLGGGYSTTLGVPNSRPASNAYLGTGSSYGTGGGLENRVLTSLSAALSNQVKQREPSYEYESRTESRDHSNSTSSRKHSDGIIITNLPPNTSWKAIRDHFNRAGDIKFAEMRGSDVGLIRFASERDAERAVALFDRTRFDGQTIDVGLL